MRLLFIPLLLVGLFIQAPIPALGNTNQQAAERIADVIGEHFPDADIAVSYRSGQVGLKGESVSQSQRKQIVERVFNIPGISVSEVSDEIQIVASKTPANVATQPARPVASAATAPVPMPGAPNTKVAVAASNTAQQQTTQKQQVPPPPQKLTGAPLAPYPHSHYQAAYGQRPGQESMVPAPFVQTSYVQHPQAGQPSPQQHIPPQHHPAYYGQPAQAAHHPEAYGPQGPMPGHYNQPHLPDYAWPAYANYPNSAQVSYPRNYSPKAWPYIGPFYPYPQVPMGWRKVTLEHNNGWWWLDFDDGTPSGPYSGLFRQPTRYTY